MQLATKITLLVLLSGCTGGEATLKDATTTMNNYQRKVANGQALAQLNTGEIATPSMPKSGTAAYTGIAGFSTSSIDADITTRNPEMVATVNMNANFSTNRISGTFTDFVSSNNANLPGSATINNGTISGNQFSGDFTGSLSGPTGSQNLTGNLLAGFVGNSANAANGEIFGTVTGTRQALPLYGIFYSRN
jgi:hypothetical protein